MSIQNTIDDHTKLLAAAVARNLQLLEEGFGIREDDVIEYRVGHLVNIASIQNVDFVQGRMASLTVQPLLANGRYGKTRNLHLSRDHHGRLRILNQPESEVAILTRGERVSKWYRENRTHPAGYLHHLGPGGETLAPSDIVDSVKKGKNTIQKIAKQRHKNDDQVRFVVEYMQKFGKAILDGDVITLSS